VNLFIPSECWTGSETVINEAASSGVDDCGCIVVHDDIVCN